MSAWQKRFGRQTFKENHRHAGTDNQSSELDFNSITQLFTKRNNEDEVLDKYGQACAEALVGRKNEFLSSHRMSENHVDWKTGSDLMAERELASLWKPSIVARLEENNLADSASGLIRTRAQVEAEANRIRSHVVEAKSKAHIHSQEPYSRNNTEPRVCKNLVLSRAKSRDRSRNENGSGMNSKTKTAVRKCSRSGSRGISSDRTKEVPFLEVKKLQLRINQVDKDNQREESRLKEFECKVQRKQMLRQVMQTWKSYHDSKRRVKNERRIDSDRTILSSVLARWRKYAETCQRSHAKESHLAIADAFFRRKYLPRCFYDWKIAARARKNLEQVQSVSEKRRQMMSKLIERLAKERNEPSRLLGLSGDSTGSKTLLGSTSHRDTDDLPIPRCEKAEQSAPPSVGTHPIASTYQMRSTQNVKPSHRMQNPVLVNMQMRANERRSRREYLKAKYADASKAKQEALLAKQAQLEMMVESRRKEEKERNREEKSVKHLKELEKQERRDRYRMVVYRALDHNRRRLLYHYGFRPLWRYQERRKAVEHKASRWYWLTLQFRLFQAWLFYCNCAQAYRVHVESQKLASASYHHTKMLSRRSLTRWKLLHAWFRHAEVVLHHQATWFNARRSLTTWINRFSQAQRRHYALREKFRQRNGCRIKALVFRTWRQAIKKAIEDRQIAREKEFLWRKAQQWLAES